MTLSAGTRLGNYEIDRPWSTGTVPVGQQSGFASFTFEPARFPHVPEMIDALQRRGYPFEVIRPIVDQLWAEVSEAAGEDSEAEDD